MNIQQNKKIDAGFAHVIWTKFKRKLPRQCFRAGIVAFLRPALHILTPKQQLGKVGKLWATIIPSLWRVIDMILTKKGQLFFTHKSPYRSAALDS